MPSTQKLDLYKQHKTEYVTPKNPTTVSIGPAQYLAICGTGAPGGQGFQDRVAALYGMAYTIKMTRKLAGKGDYTVCKLEGQYWWDPPPADPLNGGPPEELQWRLIIRTPHFVGQDDLQDAAAKLLEKKGVALAHEVELFSLNEGDCVQLLHVGPYDDERRSVARMLEFVAADGLEVGGHHHEIYLSDPRRVAPERLRTILRLPVQRRR